MNTLLCSACAGIILQLTQSAHALTYVNWSNTSGTELRDLNGVFLTEGDPQVGFDGTIVQLGFYTLATTSDPFAGEWRLIYDKTIGDKSAEIIGPGRFRYGDPVLARDGLLEGMPLSIRFYDSTTIADSTFFNAVSSIAGGWNWTHVPDVNILRNLSLTDPSLVWQGGVQSAFRTTIPVPEPASVALLAGSAAWLLGSRRRFRHHG